jgi:hypothetical protein
MNDNEPKGLNSFSFDADQVADAAAESIIDQLPEPQQHAIDQHLQEQGEAAANVEVDVDGVPYDSEIHTGTKLKSGKWRLKRKGGSVVGKTKGTEAVDAAQPTTESQSEVQARAAGQMAAAMAITLAKVYAPDFKPSEEIITLQNEAWGNYFVAKGFKDFPPGLALVIASGTLAVAAASTPKGQERTGKLKEWVRLRVVKWKVKRYLKRNNIKAKVEITNGEVLVNGSRPDFGNDGKREDNTSA